LRTKLAEPRIDSQTANLPILRGAAPIKARALTFDGELGIRGEREELDE